jgi:tetratricopeptide (TPR) repeat protein
MISGTSISAQEVQQRLLNEVSAAVAAADMRRAYETATVAVNRGMRHPILYNARGLWLQQAGRYPEALLEFELALPYMPGNATLLNAIGLTLLKLGRSTEAVEKFDAAIAIVPDFPLAHYRRGLALANSGNHDAAQGAHERAVELDPNLAEAHASLAWILARKGQSDRARALAERALSLKPGEPTARVALASLELGEKKFTEAESRLRKILKEETPELQTRAAVLSLLGDALDGQKRYAEAFDVYTQENELLRQGPARQFEGLAPYSAERMIAYFEEATAERWTAPDEGAADPDGPASHIFLLGFMRSGTTLLEQVLASNPQIVALEEKRLLHELSDRYLTSVDSLDILSALHGDQLEKDRKHYWDRVRAEGVHVKGKIFIDKQPLNNPMLPLIVKLFPKAKILFALRDPRDVVFSCYRRHFGVNATMYSFLDLESAARLYALVMQLTELYRQKLPLNLFEHRYEDMVEDFEGRVRAVCEFIGVEWDDAMRDFNKYAPTVDLRSPSATQVRRPLYSDGLAQWRRYQQQLSPILPILRPWVEKFGYPAV